MDKAFNSVSRDTVRRALTRVRVQAPTRELIMSGFEEATTELRYRSSKLGEVEQRRGVRQGDPLSTILFNLLLEALEKVNATPIGVALSVEDNSSVKVPVLAFGEDLVLMAETQAGLQLLVDEVTDSLRAGGLGVDPNKCHSLTMRVERAARSWFVAGKVDGDVIPSLGPEDFINASRS